MISYCGSWDEWQLFSHLLSLEEALECNLMPVSKKLLLNCWNLYLSRNLIHRQQTLTYTGCIISRKYKTPCLTNYQEFQGIQEKKIKPTTNTHFQLGSLQPQYSCSCAGTDLLYQCSYRLSTTFLKIPQLPGYVAGLWTYRIRSPGIVARIYIQAAPHRLGTQTKVWETFSSHLGSLGYFDNVISELYIWLGYKWLSMNPQSAY